MDGCGTVSIHRPGRALEAAPAPRTIEIAQPPHSGEADTRNGMTTSHWLGPVGMLAAAVMIGGTRYLVVTGVMAVVMLGAGVGARVGRARSERRRKENERRRHEEHLDDVEGALIEAGSAQRRRLTDAEPGPESLEGIAHRRVRIWERLPHHADFTTVRIGIGPRMPDLVPVRGRSGGVTVAADADLLERAHQLESGWRHLDELPMTVDLDGVGCLAIVGATETGVMIANAILARLAVFRSPDDLHISLHVREETTHWDWIKWLPHARTRSAAWMTVGPDELARHLQADPAGPRHITLIDSYRPGDRWGGLVEALVDECAGSDALAIVMVERAEDVPTNAGATLTVDGGTATYTRLDDAQGRISGIVPDRLDPSAAESIARSLAPLTLRGTSPSAHPASLTELIGVTPTEDDIHRHRVGSQPLCTPLGLVPTGASIRLDLREASVGGMGPHGMIIGATGSGKSELLRTLVLGLALSGTPRDVSLVFVDFKGGATFRDLEGLPHTAGAITNLEAEPMLVDRMQKSLTFEMTRRQRLLASAGVDRADQYRALSPAPPDPLPALVIVVDEFGELMAAHPGLMDMFASVARTGRSLGMHLLVSGQRIDEGRLRRLDGHLRYRFCLKTFTPEESVAVIGTKAAFDLPSEPGHGHLLLDGETIRFRVTPVSAPPASPRSDATTHGFVSVEAEETGPVTGVGPPTRESGAETLVELLARLDPPTRKVWMDPLPERLEMPSDAGTANRRRVVFGITDRPASQEQVEAEIDFTSESGHLAVVGMPKSGKSAMLARLITSLAATHSPEDVEIHVVDLGGGALHRLADLPHIGSVFGRGDAEGIDRLLCRVTEAIEDRSMESADRHLRAMFLFVDGWRSFAREHGENLSDRVRSIALDGSRHDVHVVISATRWGEIGSSLRDVITGRFELRLTEPLESEIDRRAAARVPRGVPGRGIDSTGESTQVALTPTDRSDIHRRWAGAAPVEPVRTLPRSVDPGELGRGAVGVRAPGMTDWAPDLFGSHPHLLILGDGGSGKTTALRGVLANVPVSARIAVIDVRSGLRSPQDHPALIGIASSAREAGRLTEAILDEAERPGSPPIVLAVDDHHLVSGSPDAPLERLAPLIDAGTGFHLVLTRRVAGLNRAAFDPLLRRLRDDGAPILLLSADPVEGRLWGTIDTAIRPAGRALLIEGRDTAAIQIANFQTDRRPGGAE